MINSANEVSNRQDVYRPDNSRNIRGPQDAEFQSIALLLRPGGTECRPNTAGHCEHHCDAKLIV